MKTQMAAQLVTDALIMAIWSRGKPDSLLHHSDHGSQGRFNRSAQHPKLGGVYGDGKTEVGAVDAAKVILARSATGVAA
jgi:hypothetical protein